MEALELINPSNNTAFAEKLNSVTKMKLMHRNYGAVVLSHFCEYATRMLQFPPGNLASDSHLTGNSTD